MKNKPLISVIITNYNYGQYVAEAIKSVLAQTYQNIELIIINDGSTDDSDEVITGLIRKNPERNIKYVNRENKGVVYTRNEGIELAKGEYICFLDADDYFNRNYISKSYKIAQEYDADVVYPNWHFVGDWLGRPDTDYPEFTSELLQLQKLHCTIESLIKKSAIKHLRFEFEAVGEDWDFFVGLSLDGAKFKLAKDNVINYRIRKGTRGSKNDPKVDTQHFVDILTKYKEIYGDKVIDPNRIAKLRHPNITVRILRMRYLRVIVESIKKNGIRVTARKIIGKLASRSKLLWKAVNYTRDKKYQRMINWQNIEYSPGTKLAVVLHLYYPELWPLIREKLANINIPFDLFVSVQLRDKGITLEKVNSHHQMTNVVAFPNRGRDVLPFLQIAKKISDKKQYEYLLKVHSKKSLHRKDGNEWLNSLLGQLVPADISSIIKTLEKKDTGVIGPSNHVVSLSKYMGGNRNLMAYVMEKMTNDKTIEEILFNQNRYPFFGGTMFWCRTDFLAPLINAKLTPTDFNTEIGQVDSTTAHAIERLLGKALHKISSKRMYIVNRGVVTELPDKSYRATYKHVG